MRKTIAFTLIVILSIGGVLLYRNFNRLLSEALTKSFNTNLASDVYELKFEKLRVNLLEGSIQVMNVVMQPRGKPLKDYAYINSSFRLKTDRIYLENVEIWTLLQSNMLRLERISITKPDIELVIADLRPVFLPFKDSTAMVANPGEHKRTIDSYSLKEFQLIDAAIHITNSAKEREFKITNFNISLNNLMINQTNGMDQVTFEHVGLSVGEFAGHLRHSGVRHLSFKDYKIGIDSLKLQMTVDTVMFRCDDFTAGLRELELQTRDSLFHLSVKSFSLSYKKKFLMLSNLSFKPNISEAAMQNRFKFQHTSESGTIGSLEVRNLDFDALVYHRSVFIDKIIIDNPAVSIFKDNTKPVDKNRVPKYFGQQISSISIPLQVKEINATNVNLVNVERKRDSSYAKVDISRGTVTAKNITNRSGKPMTLRAEAYLGNKVHVDLRLGFDYKKPEFSVNAKFARFSLPDLNPVIEAYTPAKINAGIADEIGFSGMVYETHANGTMKFLYHDLEVDLNLPKKAKWKSSVIAFAANTVLNSSNPGSAKVPARIVQYHVERDMNKGFINIIIKSALTGIKETLMMSKENKKAYKQAKKQMR